MKPGITVMPRRVDRLRARRRWPRLRATEAIRPPRTTIETLLDHLAVADDDAGIGDDEILRQEFGRGRDSRENDKDDETRESVNHGLQNWILHRELHDARIARRSGCGRSSRC